MFENLDTYYQFQGYDTFIGPTNQGRGVGIFVRTEICADKVVMETDFQESVWCSIKLQNSDSLLIGCIYKSPNCSNENCLELFQLFGKVKDMRYSHKLIMGDFNFRDINWTDMSTSSNEQQNSTLFIESIRDSFMFQHVLEPTRYRANNEPSILDLIFSNEEGMVSDIQYNPSVGRSDHLVLSFKFNCYTPNTSKNNTHSRYNFFKGDYQSIISQLEQTNWEGEMEGLDLSSSWLWFTEQYIDLLEKFIPESKPRQKREKAGPVVTQSCLDAIKNKHRKWLKYKYCKSPVNFNQYKIARNAVTLELRSAKYAYEKDLAARIKTDNKLFWNYVSKNSKTKKSVSQLLSSDGTLTSSDQETANTLNEYVSSVFSNENTNTIPDFNDRNFNHELDQIVITEKKVEEIISNLKPSKSQGPDKIHPHFLKQTKDQLKKPLCILFNKSFQESKLPDCWKKANVTAIFKKGDKKLPENYRPISLTSVPGKIMERIIRDEIVQHMTTNNLFTECQHGFIAGKSCTTQLLEYIEDITQALDTGMGVDVIYLDFQKAFDKVPHQRLLKKLYAYGIRGHTYQWIKEFLSNRQQRVTINGSKSEWRDVTSGIPQGSVLGPVLFLVFINDFPDVIEVLLKLFADDAKLYSVISSLNDVQPLQRSVNNAGTWSIDWEMLFNIKKCHQLHVGPQDTGYTYTMQTENGPQAIEKVANEKDLGVIIDSKLTFRDHISAKVNLANRNLGIIFRTFTYLDTEMFMSLYKSLVRPHLEYATVIWSPLYKKDRISIENVQRRATKLVRACKNLSYPERLRKLGLPTLEYRRQRADIIQVYKILNDIDKVDKNKLFSVITYNRTRGHPKKVV